ncbi:DUF3015 family protein [Glaciecola sp. MH2013]|uniref:DUF3015 family protein n=1 Tax=Glaciecola sp. MH2013 TaxID=2785524 RepID=UPI0018A09C7C|nr:DUF3015 family protein [Glaciecola sp. MH2013]MBF7074375.1 DUF3015 family protein [Glaciecola sp. MH2013]
MKKIITVAAIALTASFSSMAQAEMNPWAECGIGATIFPDNGTAATISNIIWDLGTTAVTSASASEDSCQGANATTAQFITESYDNLEDELVRGEGQHVTAMLNLMSCDASASTAIRTEVADQLLDSTESTVVKAERLYNIAASACSAS